ncbi:MAG TPA: metallopeptidase TldD-related protein [Candidatus Acidoferrales bacterium]|nr:metallopeptidase TldD-related protein [Candidatus Acidoferrales bacterium]
MRNFSALALLAAFAIPVAAAQAPVPAGDRDQTLRAMHDEMERARTRLSLAGVDKPFYIEYRLLDLDIRSVTASFGALVSSSGSRTRFMSVDVRVGDYHLDSSNFVSEDGFQGFLGQTGEVGIDRDYNSLRQDLWLATDQAYKAAVTQMSLKQAFLRSLTKPPEIDDFSEATPLVKVDPRIEPDWTSRNWEDEARTASAALRDFPQLYGSRINYYLVYTTAYRMTSEGTTIRVSRHLAAIEAALDTEADDGMPLHNFYATYAAIPAGLPDSAAVAKALAQAGNELLALRSSALVSDYTGPVLFDAPAAASVLAQVLEPSLSGARPPLSMTQNFDSFLERFGGRSEWTGRVGTRVLPTSVSLVDDPTLQEFQAQPLLGGYDVDDEGVKAERVSLVENGILKDLLMSRRPGPDFSSSNGHARSAMLTDVHPLSSNLILQASDPLKPSDLRKKFLDACRDDGHEWCLEIKRMDNPALSSVRQEDFSDFIGEMGGDIASGARMPLIVSRVYVADGHEEPVRGGVIQGLTLRSMRNIAAFGDDPVVDTYMQNPTDGLAGTALGAFGSAQGGIPSTMIAPSLLLDDVEIRGFHGEPRRLPLVPAPPLK